MMANADIPDRTGGAAISVAGLRKSFGANTVLEDISLDIEPGAFVSIVGKSGCGKSTLLRLLIGLETPSAGTIASPALKTGEARIVFQEPRLLPWARAAQNVEVGLGPRAARGDPAALEALTRVGLGARGADWPAQLSGGQRQRVALARALVSRPRLLALDEPLGALDALTRIEMQSLIEQVWRAQGFTALLVTHDVSEAVALGDRVLLIEDRGVALDLAINLARPRHRGDAALAAIEGRILDHLFRQPAGGAIPSDEAAETEPS
jgi:sulfonate transport system ATP-binding protein